MSDAARVPIDRPFLAMVPTGAVVVAVVLLLLAVGPATLGPTAGAARWIGPGKFSNQVLEVGVAGSTPTVVVGASNATLPYGLNATFREIDEYRGTGQLLARANFAKARWTATNSSSSAGLGWEYAAAVPELRTNDSSVLGDVGVYLNLTLFAGAAETGSSAASVHVDIAIVNWTWVHSVDTLSLALGLAPRDAAIEHLAPGPTYTIDGVPNGTSTASEYLAWESSAVLDNASSGPTLVPIAAQLTGSPTSSTLEVAFANAFEGRLLYGLDLGLPVAAAAPLVPLGLGLIGATVATVGAVGLATFAWILRAPPKSPGRP